MSEISEIFDRFAFKKHGEYVIQKYIENPLIIKNRKVIKELIKFDIRQLVMICDYSPLSIYFYEECYIRFSAEEYDTNDIKNKFAHLTNNSIGKYSKNFDNSSIKGNMWAMAQFSEFLLERTGQDYFSEKMKPRMKEIVIATVKSGKHIAIPRKRSFEIVGFDFLIDEELNPWLLEVNSSPAMDYSTHITENLIKQHFEDIPKVLFGKKNKGERDIGNFSLIYSE